MKHRRTVAALLLILGLPTLEAAEPVDFARDVRPVLQQHCVECHGPEKQNGGYRLDQRSRALSGVMRQNIRPGSSAGSVLYHRLTGGGPQMPPKEPLSLADVETLRRWIDEGAVWPEALANDAAVPPRSAAAAELMERVRLGDRKTALEAIRKNPSIVNERGSRGATPLMYAALYGDAPLLAAMLDSGADPNLRNDAGATALLWAIDDIDKARLLLDRGADVNAASVFGRTPLMLATGVGRSEKLVKLLLERGAVPVLPALAASAFSGNVPMMRSLLAAGVHDNGLAASLALRFDCTECLQALAADRPIPPLPRALLDAVPPTGPGDSKALLDALERGADVNARDPLGRTVLMRAVVSESLSPETLQLLIERGADVQARDREAFTAMDYARRVGRKPLIDVLARVNAPASTSSDTASEARPKPAGGNDPRAAVARSIPLLQRAGIAFYEKGGCVSCHHNLLTAMTVATARSRGFSVDETAACLERSTLTASMEAGRDATLQGASVPGGGGATTTGYVLMGLAASDHAPDALTDELVRVLRHSQRPDGHWRSAFRPPSESSEITATAVALRGLRLYASDQRTVDAEAITAATSWLEKAAPQNTEDRVFRLFGLTWAGAPRALVEPAVRKLAAGQRPDGGWAQLPSLDSDAYATGSALVALQQAGMSVTSTTYRRGVRYLLNNQQADGSWRVTTRAHRTQVHFDSGFPHGMHQFISAAATNWATQAIALAAGPSLSQPSGTRRPALKCPGQ